MNARYFYDEYTNDGGATFCHQLAQFLSTLQTGVKADDRTAVSQLVYYPLDSNIPVNNETEFVHEYDQLIDATRTQQIYAADIGNVSIIDYYGVMIDNGFWLKYIQNYDAPSSSYFVISSMALPSR